MIDFGLTRISQLVRLLQYPFPWRAIHVAGTNGKGSVCAYISAALSRSRLRAGRFTSPQLVDRWDCISIDEAPVARVDFLSAEAHVRALDAAHAVGATEFELLTATAFEVFTRARVRVAVVEVGMGGRADATNVLADPLVSVLTRVAIDHEAYLGATLAEIAWHKAGIVKRGVPVVVDATNDQVVLDTVDAAAREAAAGEVVRAQEGAAAITCELGRIACAPALRGGYQRANAAVAAHALAVAARTFPQITAAAVAAGIAGAAWPGRLDVVDVSPLLAPRAASRPTEALLDGAHNPQAAAALAEYVDARRGGGSVNWVLAATQGKQLPAILAQLLRSGDGVFAVPFGPVDGMPWVQCVPPRDIARLAHNVLAALGGAGEVHPCASEVEGLQLATSMPPGRTVVVAGSLYLVGSVLRKLRDKTQQSTTPPSEEGEQNM